MVKYARSRIGFLLLLLFGVDDADGVDDAMMIGGDPKKISTEGRGGRARPVGRADYSSFIFL